MRVVQPPSQLPPPLIEQSASVQHAIAALRRAGLPAGRAESFVRSLRELGIQKPGRFILGLCSDYKHATVGWSVRGALHAPADEFECVAYLLDTILFHRPDMARLELSAAAAMLADDWLEKAGHDLPDEAPGVLYLSAFQAGITTSARAEGLRLLVAWRKPSFRARLATNVRRIRPRGARRAARQRLIRCRHGRTQAGPRRPPLSKGWNGTSFVQIDFLLGSEAPLKAPCVLHHALRSHFLALVAIDPLLGQWEVDSCAHVR